MSVKRRKITAFEQYGWKGEKRTGREWDFASTPQWPHDDAPTPQASAKEASPLRELFEEDALPPPQELVEQDAQPPPPQELVEQDAPPRQELIEENAPPPAPDRDLSVPTVPADAEDAAMHEDAAESLSEKDILHSMGVLTGTMDGGELVFLQVDSHRLMAKRRGYAFNLTSFVEFTNGVTARTDIVLCHADIPKAAQFAYMPPETINRATPRSQWVTKQWKTKTPWAYIHEHAAMIVADRFGILRLIQTLADLAAATVVPTTIQCNLCHEDIDTSNGPNHVRTHPGERHPDITKSEVYITTCPSCRQLLITRADALSHGQTCNRLRTQVVFPPPPIPPCVLRASATAHQKRRDVAPTSTEMTNRIVVMYRDHHDLYFKYPVASNCFGIPGYGVDT